MKKQYISPVCEVMEVKIGNLLIGSTTIDLKPGTGSSDDMDDIGDGGIGGGSHGDFWGD